MRLRIHLLTVPLLALAAAAPAEGAVPQTPAAELVSVREPAGTPAGAADVQLAGGGRFAVFTSTANDIVAGQSGFDTNGACDVFRRDLLMGTTVLVSRAPGGGGVGSECSRTPRISSEGSVVAFATSAPNLITAAGGSGAPVGVEQVLVADLAAGTLTVASRADGSSGALAGGRSSDGRADLSLSGDGTRVAFVAAGALQPGVAAAGDQLWMRDLTAGTTTLVSAQNGTATTPITDTPFAPSTDQYGLRTAFQASGQQVLVREPGNVTTLASQTTLGTVIDGASPALSANGRAVAFTTRSFAGPGFTQEVVVRDLAAGTTTLASHPAGAPSTIANSDVGPPAISGRGNVVSFATAATNLGIGNTGGHAQVYVADLRRGLLSFASAAVDGNGGNGDSNSVGEGQLVAPALAQDGIVAAYTSRASNLVAADGDVTPDAIVRRVRNAQPVPANATRELTTNGLDGRNVGEQRRLGNAATGEGISDLALSANGRYAAFFAAQDRYAGDPRPVAGGDTVAYVRDRLTGEVESVSRASDAGGRPGALMTGFCSARDGLAISATGRYVTFCSGAGLYRRDREAGTTVRVDVTPSGGPANGDSLHVGISASGRYVAFGSYADNLVPGTVYNALPKLYLRDLQAGTTVRVDLRDGTTDDAGFTTPGMQLAKPSVSDDGRFVAFEFADASLVPGTGITAGYPQAYVRDLQTNRTHLLNRAENGDYGRYGPTPTGQTDSRAPQLTPDARYVVFSSNASNLVPGQTSTSQAVYRQRLTFGGAGGAIDGALDLVSVPYAGGGTQLDSAAGFPAISDDGVRVAFRSTASNAVNGATGTLVYGRDLPGGTTFVVSRADGSGGANANGPTDIRPAVSADGSVIAFASSATNLEGDTSNQQKAFARTFAATAGTTAPTSTSPPTVSPSSPRTGEVATCGVGAWTGTPSFTFAWLLDGIELSGVTDSSYTPSASADGKSLRCRVTASNAAGSSSATSAAVTITQAPPTVSVTGSPVFAETVTCDPGRWAGDPTLAFVWRIADSASAPGTLIPGATGPTLELEAPQVERWLRCEATVTAFGSPVAVSSEARFVRPEITVVRSPEPLTAPREGEAFTCSDTELRVRPSGLGIEHGYFVRILRANGEIANDSSPSRVPGSNGPLGVGSAGTKLVCIDAGTVGAGTSFRAEGTVATIQPLAPAPTPTPAVVPALPLPTAPPAVAFAKPLERFCRAATYASALQGLQRRFTWSYHDAAGTPRAVPATELKAGLLGEGQVFTGVSAFGQFGGSQPAGLSCAEVISDGGGRERATRSAIVHPRVACTKIETQGGKPGPSGIPVGVISAWCAEFDDSGQDDLIASAPPLPAPPLSLGTGLTATIQLGCGAAVTTTPGCRFSAALYLATGSATKARRAAAGAVTTSTRLGARIAQVRGQVRRGQRTATVRLRISGAGAKALRKSKTVQTILVVRYGRAKPQAIAAPVLQGKRASRR